MNFYLKYLRPFFQNRPRKWFIKFKKKVVYFLYKLKNLMFCWFFVIKLPNLQKIGKKMNYAHKKL